MPPIKLGRKPGEVVAPKVQALSQTRDWLATQYEVETENTPGGEDGPRKLIDGKSCGLLGVGKSFPNRKGELTEGHNYSLTHLPTGYRILSLRAEEDCMRVGEYLLAHCKRALYSESAKETRLAIPENIKEWIRACRAAIEWVDPVAFIENLKAN